MSSHEGACISLRTLAMKSLLVLRNATALSIHCFMFCWNCGERRNSFQLSPKTLRMASRISRRRSGGGELGDMVNAVCMSLDMDSIQIF